MVIDANFHVIAKANRREKRNMIIITVQNDVQRLVLKATHVQEDVVSVLIKANAAIVKFQSNILSLAVIQILFLAMC